MTRFPISTPVQLNHVTIHDSFWSSYISLVRDVVVPYQWEALNDRIPGSEPSHAIRNFKIAAGLEQGSFYGMVFQDSDVAKWLEAVGYLLVSRPDPDLEKIADEVVDLLAKAQQSDGYLNTYFTLKEPAGRWSNLAECHELYCAGHLIEAAVAYEQATGKSKILEVACRLADCIDSVFGPEEGKLKGYDGHQEIELALVKLYRATRNNRYLRLAQFFLDERGQTPHFYDWELARRNGEIHFKELRMSTDKGYSQAHLPVRLQNTAEGHAVRVVYMCTGMADVAAETGDKELLEACRALWRNMVRKRMYITGAIGSMSYGEAFTLDYDLPGDTAYAETCASIGLVFFAQRMLQIEASREYADILERALYNTVIAGMSRDGRRFFYVNPLEAWPAASGKNRNLEHVKMERQQWFGCACCPPNIARLLASLGSYIYSVRDDILYAHLYIGSQTTLEVEGRSVELKQHANLPWDGDIRFELAMGGPQQFSLALRIPGWCDEWQVSINGTPATESSALLRNGYLYLNREWRNGDIVQLSLPMKVHLMKGNPDVRETIGMVAVQRGPLIYCLEENDNGSGLHKLLLHSEPDPRIAFDNELLGGMLTIELSASRMLDDDWTDQLYRANVADRMAETKATFIPYFAWANRGLGEMRVWVREHTVLPS